MHCLYFKDGVFLFNFQQRMWHSWINDFGVMHTANLDKKYRLDEALGERRSPWPSQITTSRLLSV